MKPDHFVVGSTQGRTGSGNNTGLNGERLKEELDTYRGHTGEIKYLTGSEKRSQVRHVFVQDLLQISFCGNPRVDFVKVLS